MQRAMRYIRKITGTTIFAWSETLAARKDMVECDAKGTVIGTSVGDGPVLPDASTPPVTSSLMVSDAPLSVAEIVGAAKVQAPAVEAPAPAVVTTPEPATDPAPETTATAATVAQDVPPTTTDPDPEPAKDENEGPRPIDEMTKVELQLTARELGIKFKPQDNKAKLLAAIHAVKDTAPAAVADEGKADAGK